MRNRLEHILEDLVIESRSNKDFKVYLNSLRMDESGRIFNKDLGSTVKGALMTDYAKTQILTRVGMPVAYSKKLLTLNPELVSMQFNFWVEDLGKEEEIMLRCFEDNEGELVVRGVLSGKYSIMDNLEVFDTLSSLQEDLPEFSVEGYEKNENRLHVRLAFEDVYEDFGVSVEGKRDIVKSGIDIINSEVGSSSLVIAPITYRLVCTNGLKAWGSSGDVFRQRHVHVGRDEFKGMVKDNLSRSIDVGLEMLEEMSNSRKIKMENPLFLIEGIGEEYKLSGKMIERVKDAYMIEPEKNLYGLVNSFTRAARDLPNHDYRLKVEEVASHVMREFS